ncbi:SDR family NAD(P)-dependent oxidoreductase [Curvibacter sp. APW13]|uniref:SDR family NAD(P)-dependent oxidoreductase n=1 Tax=Curvibacter sp. APW13 TaxID=3077236 RepID=UPI0028DEA302|nr:SDR family NAD(P)-dependent oxidoreductase [Curvibacter sp. APW13]MDT8990831.1 SDR family NAD(P)-dependent oxidoreductase [Curvibacter sp. APW13]
MNLDHKHIVISGGGGALGRAVARRAQTYGARVTLLDRQPVQDLPAGMQAVAVNLADASATAAVFASLEPVDAVVAVAGGFAMGAAVHDADDTQWESMMAMNVVPLRNVIKAAVPAMLARKRGRIVTVGALSALQGKAAMGAYTASKAVVMNLTESLAAELAGTNIRANAVLPSIIDTPANRAAMPDADYSAWTAPDDIAEVMCFLSSDQSQAIHGALIPVGGAPLRA